MRKSYGLISAVLAGLAAPVIAGDGSIPTMDLTPYLVSKGPDNLGYDRASALAKLQTAPAQSVPVTAGLERPASLNGTLYAVVAPTYSGSTVSYIRLFNGASATSTFSVTMIGSPSGTTYGTAMIQVPSSASIQYPVTPAGGTGSIQSLANAGNLANGDTSYSLYIQDSDAASGYEHVTYNNNNAFFENNSICSTLLSQAIASVSNSVVLINVHTTQLSAYPATITIHNFWNAAVTYKVTMIDARNGSVIGQTNIATQANSTYSLPESSLEQTLGFTPSSAQLHVNIFITDPTGAPPYDLAGVSIVNNALNANINMSTACAVNAVANTSSLGSGGGLNGY